MDAKYNYFQNTHLPFKQTVDLFGSRLNKQFSYCVSQKPDSVTLNLLSISCK